MLGRSFWQHDYSHNTERSSVSRVWLTYGELFAGQQARSQDSPWIDESSLHYVF